MPLSRTTLKFYARFQFVSPQHGKKEIHTKRLNKKKGIPQKFNTYLNTIFPYFSPHCWADGYTISYKKVELTVKN